MKLRCIYCDTIMEAKPSWFVHGMCPKCGLHVWVKIDKKQKG